MKKNTTYQGWTGSPMPYQQAHCHCHGVPTSRQWDPAQESLGVLRGIPRVHQCHCQVRNPRYLRNKTSTVTQWSAQLSCITRRTYRGCASCGSSGGGGLVVLFPLISHQAKRSINPGLWPSVMAKIQSLGAWMQDYVQSVKFPHKNPWDEYLHITILNMCDSSVCP